MINKAMRPMTTPTMTSTMPKPRLLARMTRRGLREEEASEFMVS